MPGGQRHDVRTGSFSDVKKGPIDVCARLQSAGKGDVPYSALPRQVEDRSWLHSDVAIGHRRTRRRAIVDHDPTSIESRWIRQKSGPFQARAAAPLLINHVQRISPCAGNYEPKINMGHPFAKIGPAQLDSVIGANARGQVGIRDPEVPFAAETTDI